MILKKALRLLIAGAALAAAAAVVVVALAYALYAVALDYVSPAAAAAIVAGAAALLAVLMALVLSAKAKIKPAPAEPQSLTARMLEMARERPLLAAGAVAVAGVLAVRNPRLLTVALTTLFAAKPSDPKKR